MTIPSPVSNIPVSLTLYSPKERPAPTLSLMHALLMICCCLHHEHSLLIHRFLPHPRHNHNTSISLRVTPFSSTLNIVAVSAFARYKSRPQMMFHPPSKHPFWAECLVPHYFADILLYNTCVFYWIFVLAFGFSFRPCLMINISSEDASPSLEKSLRRDVIYYYDPALLAS
jgi:hypothetical protein